MPGHPDRIRRGPPAPSGKVQAPAKAWCRVASPCRPERSRGVPRQVANPICPPLTGRTYARFEARNGLKPSGEASGPRLKV
jgi:hypothetical protein